MRTTLDIDDDILLAAKELARQDKISAGTALSRLARSALTRPPARADASMRGSATDSPLGIAVLPKGDEIISNEHVNRLRDELDI